MAYTAYDWQQTLIEKADYAESRLRRGSPVVGVSYDQGLLLLTVSQGQRKLYEIYDRLAMGGLGNPSDLEVVRQFAVDFAHAEGYQRSTQDVSVQRVVGFAISPPFKTAFSDPRRMPIVLRSLFAQVGETVDDDVMFVLGYDGEFQRHGHRAVIGGTVAAEARMRQVLDGWKPGKLNAALEQAVVAWTAGYWQPEAETAGEEGEDEVGPPSEADAAEVRQAVAERGARLEAVVLERDTPRERRYRVLDGKTLAPLMPELKGAE